MNVLFMTIGKMDNVEEHTIYCDLLRYFRDAGHSVYTISPYEKRTGLQTAYEEKNGIHMLHVRTGNVTGMVSLTKLSKNSPTSSGSEMNCGSEHKCSKESCK